MGISVLVGDVGGTNSRWAIFNEGLGPVVIRPTSESRSVQDAISDWIGSVDACGVAVAGPVKDGCVSLTNANWYGREADIGKPARFVNDLEAVALAVPMLKDSDLDWWANPVVEPERVLCIGVGTGFGGALWTRLGVQAMEPGHEMLDGFEFDHPVTVEDIVSGPGLDRLRQRGLDAEKMFGEAFALALQRLVDRTQADAVFLIGGVVDGCPQVFQSYLPARLSVARISHPHPALLGAAAAAIDAFVATP